MTLKLELAVTFDVGEHFVKATHFLEGAGPFFSLLGETERRFLNLSSSLFPERPCNCNWNCGGGPRPERNST